MTDQAMDMKSGLHLGSKELMSVPEMVMIEMPFLSIKEDENAFTSFGGITRVMGAIQSQKKVLGMSFDQADPLRQPLQGTCENASGLLVRVRTRKMPESTTSSSSSSSSSSNITAPGEGELTFHDDGEVSYAVVGRVSSAYHFHRPADYQFLSSCCASDYKTYDAPRSAALAELVPRPFSHTPPDGQLADLFSSEVTINAVKDREEHIATPVGVGDSTLPTRPVGSYWENNQQRGNRERTHSFISLLQNLFKARPCWARRQLDANKLLQTSLNLIKDVLPYVAFWISMGPFKDLWNRWEYDTSKTTGSRHYQIIQVRLSLDFWNSLNKRVHDSLSNVRANRCINLDTLKWEPLNNNDEEDHSDMIPLKMFNNQVKRVISVQICQVPSKDILDFVRRMNVNPQYDKSTGWYSEKATALLRQRLTQYLSERVNEFIKQYTEETGNSKSSSSSSKTDGGSKNVEEKLGFPTSMWEWQRRYEDLPTVFASTRDEQAENENTLRAMIAPPFLSKPKLNRKRAVKDESVLPVPRLVSSAAKATKIKPTREVNVKEQLPKKRKEPARAIVPRTAPSELDLLLQRRLEQFSQEPPQKQKKLLKKPPVAANLPMPAAQLSMLPSAVPLEAIDTGLIMASKPFGTFSSDSDDSENGTSYL